MEFVKTLSVYVYTLRPVAGLGTLIISSAFIGIYITRSIQCDLLDWYTIRMLLMHSLCSPHPIYFDIIMYLIQFTSGCKSISRINITDSGENLAPYLKILYLCL